MLLCVAVYKKTYCCSIAQYHSTPSVPVQVQVIDCCLYYPLSLSPPGLEFPWGPKPFAEVVTGPLLRNNRQTTDSSSLEGHYVGVYFSAHWVSEERRWTLVHASVLSVCAKKQSEQKGALHIIS